MYNMRKIDIFDTCISIFLFVFLTYICKLNTLITNKLIISEEYLLLIRSLPRKRLK